MNLAPRARVYYAADLSEDLALATDSQHVRALLTYDLGLNDDEGYGSVFYRADDDGQVTEAYGCYDLAPLNASRVYDLIGDR